MEVTHAPQQRLVIRDHCVTEAEGVTFPYANRATSLVSLVLNLTRLQTRVGGFKASSCTPRVLHQHPALHQHPWPLCAGSTPWHTASAPLTLRAGSTPAHPRSAPPPLRAGSMPPASAHWVSVPRSARRVDVVLVLVPPR